MMSKTLNKQDIETYAKQMRSRILSQHGVRIYSRVLKLLKIFLETPEEYLIRLPNSRNEATSMSQQIINTLQDRDNIKKLVDIWMEIDKSTFRRGGDRDGDTRQA